MLESLFETLLFLPGGTASGSHGAGQAGRDGDPAFGSARGQSSRLGLSAGSSLDGANGGLSRGAEILWRGDVRSRKTAIQSANDNEEVLGEPL